MKNEKVILTEEELSGILDLTPENVEKIYVFSSTNYNGEKLLSKSEENYFINKIDICREQVDSFPSVYIDMHKLRTVRVPVLNFLRQLRVIFMNKGLSVNEEKYKN